MTLARSLRGMISPKENLSTTRIIAATNNNHHRIMAVPVHAPEGLRPPGACTSACGGILRFRSQSSCRRCGLVDRSAPPGHRHYPRRSMTWVAPQVRSAQPCPFAVFARRSRVPVTRRRRSDRDSGCRTPPAPRRRGLDRSHSRRRRGSWLRRRDQTRGALVRSSSRDGELHVPTRRALQECMSVKLLVPVFFKKKTRLVS
jgi:hypothetical protein